MVVYCLRMYLLKISACCVSLELQELLFTHRCVFYFEPKQAFNHAFNYKSGHK